MPVGRYDKYFGGERGAAEKARASMRKSYGPKDGDHVFFARVAKLKRRGRPKKGQKR